MPQNKDLYESEDFIIIKFECPVIPIKIKVYETFNPGAIVRIWGRGRENIWSLLYHGQPSINVKHEAQVFCPKMRIVSELIE